MSSLPLAKKLDILIQEAKAFGQDVSYRSIAKRTALPGSEEPIISAENLQRIHQGQNFNPRYHTLRALARAFNVDLMYFDDSIANEKECRQYVHSCWQKTLDSEITMRSLEGDVPPEAIQSIRTILETYRKRRKSR